MRGECERGIYLVVADVVMKIIAQDIVETIYRLVLRHFNDPSDPSDPESLERYNDETDEWVECWVGCANVLVQNGRRVSTGGS